ncbi:hypothetical protein PIB30_085581 [Stylosanthes scabra]|uniref:Uncharacterized protein n=1 Tax=Stylosanthes scabra TaxID=79078 RepID=A0ABU6YRS9_9FABA|nr:hypothetical protein [Stylosanthes scabra]
MPTLGFWCSDCYKNASLLMQPFISSRKIKYLVFLEKDSIIFLLLVPFLWSPNGFVSAIGLLATMQASESLT